MSAWPSRGGLQRPLRGAEKMKTEQQHQVVRPCRSDSSQQASTKPGAVQFPTSVGMNRTSAQKRQRLCRVPHERGDEPSCSWIIWAAMVCSPRAWG